MNYYISDTHFNCRNRYEGRTLEHDAIIKANWNERVCNNDVVYIIGDVGREGGNRDNEYLCEIVSTLKGKKVLIQGNHEKIKDARLRQLFVEICSYKEVSDNFNGANNMVVMCHYPILMWNNQHKGWIHLYGHVHQTEEWNVYKESLRRLNDYFAQMTAEGKTDCPQAKAFNVGAALLDWTPRTLKEIIEANDKYSSGGNL